MDRMTASFIIIKNWVENINIMNELTNKSPIHQCICDDDRINIVYDYIEIDLYPEGFRIYINIAHAEFIAELEQKIILNNYCIRYKYAWAAYNSFLIDYSKLSIIEQLLQTTLKD